jgi:hypothetical protein
VSASFKKSQCCAGSDAVKTVTPAQAGVHGMQLPTRANFTIRQTITSAMDRGLRPLLSGIFFIADKKGRPLCAAGAQRLTKWRRTICRGATSLHPNLFFSRQIIQINALPEREKIRRLLAFKVAPKNYPGQQWACAGMT